jgi:hypothetical protein
MPSWLLLLLALFCDLGRCIHHMSPSQHGAAGGQPHAWLNEALTLRGGAVKPKTQGNLLFMLKAFGMSLVDPGFEGRVKETVVIKRRTSRKAKVSIKRKLKD